MSIGVADAKRLQQGDTVYFDRGHGVESATDTAIERTLIRKSRVYANENNVLDELFDRDSPDARG